MDRSGAVLLERLAEGDIEPIGNVTVEIKDERGKTIDKETKHNFISKVWKAWARASLRWPWMGFAYNYSYADGYVGTNLGITWPFGRGTTPLLPIRAIGCWNDTTAEDSVNEHRITLPASSTGMIAWASRWPFASATGARGSVNTSESLVDEDTVRFVFDWVSANGNGTFQSVGWFEPGAPGIPWMGFGAAHRGRAVSATLTPSSHIASATSLNMGGGWFDTVSKKWYMLVSRQATSGALRVISFDFTNVLDDASVSILGTKNTTGLTATNESDEFTPTSGATSVPLGINMLGIDSSNRRVFAYLTSSGSLWRWGTVPSSGASTTYAHPVGDISGSAMVGAVIGGFVYLSCGTTGSTSSIYKMNTATGALDTTIAIDASVSALCTLAGITTPRIYAMTTDGTDLYVMYGQTSTVTATQFLLVRLNQSGVLQEILGTVPHSQSSSLQSESTGSPFAGTMQYNGPRWWDYADEYLLTADGSNASSTTEDRILGPTTVNDGATLPTTFNTSALQGLQIVYADGTLYMVGSGLGGTPSTLTQFTWGVMRMGYNLGSRVLLGTPKTKTVGQTMKITYDITLPGWF